MKQNNNNKKQTVALILIDNVVTRTINKYLNSTCQKQSWTVFIFFLFHSFTKEVLFLYNLYHRV